MTAEACLSMRVSQRLGYSITRVRRSSPGLRPPEHWPPIQQIRKPCLRLRRTDAWRKSEGASECDLTALHVTARPVAQPGIPVARRCPPRVLANRREWRPLARRIRMRVRLISAHGDAMGSLDRDVCY